MKVCLDPGHGGKDPGGCGHGMQEKHLVLDIAIKAASMLQARGIPVVLTRTKDVYVSIGDRYRLATRSGCDLFISIHTDAYYSQAHGFSLLFFNNNSKNTIGQLLRQELLAVHNDWNRWIYGDYVGVLVHATMPAILTENLFITNPDNAALLAQDSFRTDLARAHTRAICRYYGVPYDVGAEGSEDSVAVYNLQEKESQKGPEGEDLFVWVTPEGFTENAMFGQVACYLNIYNEDSEPVEALIWCNKEGNLPGEWPVSSTIPAWTRKSIDMRGLVGDKSDGFSTTLKCRSKNIAPTMTILAK